MIFFNRNKTKLLASLFSSRYQLLHKSTITIPTTSTSNLLSHKVDTKFTTIDYDNIKERLKLVPPSIGSESGIRILDQLCESDFGKFLLKNKGLNGYWTQYVTQFPYKGRITARNQVGKPLSEMEKFLLNKSPQFLSTQERFVIFQKFLRDQIKPNMTVASIPCGLMDEILTLRVEKIEHVEVVGIDVDHESLEHAVWNYQTLSATPTYNNFTLKTEQKDAFNLESENRFDIITSNGLNIYVEDDDRVIELYKEFYKALKPDGILLTSHVVYPPHEFDDEDFEYANTIFYEILNCNWKSRSVEACVSQLFAAGFDVISIEFDSRQLYPTFFCKKRGTDKE